ncbi:MAG: multifunctional CCA addition/repair protein [Pseudomonadota bacterium]|nr:multifunctional CCA addition/repair protein [Pseudomonadota bacterium]
MPDEYKVYKVGGAVRDRLLGQPTQDQDWVVVGATPAQLLQQGYTPVGKDFPVFLHPKTREEYALARTERKTHAGYKGFQVDAAPDVTLEEDLQRRDLTINAMAEDQHGRLIDPFNGQADLQAGILRHVAPAFVEDPVRILRVARFAARLNFQVAAETLALMQQMVNSGEVNALVAERVWQEWVRALATPYPQRFFEVLRQCGALAVIFPEIERLFHHHQAGQQLMSCLQQARMLTADTAILFAVLTHNMGLSVAEGLEHIKNLCHRYRIPNHYCQLASLVRRHHPHCHHLPDKPAEQQLKTLYALDALRRPQRFEQFLLACEALFRGQQGTQAYPLAKHMRQLLHTIAQVNAQDIVAAGFKGKAVGEELFRRQLAVLSNTD